MCDIHILHWSVFNRNNRTKKDSIILFKLRNIVQKNWNLVSQQKNHCTVFFHNFMRQKMCDYLDIKTELLYYITDYTRFYI